MVRHLVFIGLLVFGASFALNVTADAQQGSKAQPRGTTAQMHPAPPGALPALPQVSFEPVRPMPVVRQVYEFAARHPEVLSYIPCFCGCERVGHGANHDCFVKSRAANGRITEWDAHGMGCAVCLDVGRKAMTMFNQGMTVSAIRASIEREYSPHFSTRTPTPQPPKAGAKS
jgi:hypothetical protein